MRVIGGRSRGRRLAGQAAQVRPAHLGPGARVDLRHPRLPRRRRGPARRRPLLRQRRPRGRGALPRRRLGDVRRPRPRRPSAVRQNLDAVGLADADVTLVRAALPGWLEAPARRAETFDLALCDPPYDFADWPALLEALDAETVVMESSSPIALPDTWVVARERRYGGTLITVAHQRGDAAATHRRGRRMKVGLFPGSFDPFHNGHLEIVERASQALRRGRGRRRAQPPEGQARSSTSKSARSCSSRSPHTSRASGSCRCRR